MSWLLGATGGFLLGYVAGALLRGRATDDARARGFVQGHGEGYRRGYRMAIENEYAEGDEMAQWSERSVH